MNRIFLPVLVASALATGCYGTTAGSMGYSTNVGMVGPDLAYVSPGVSVVADFNEPIFFSDGFYWRNQNNGWHRSNFYNTGWQGGFAAPYGVVSIGNQNRFRNYRPNGYVRGGGYFGPRGYDRPVNRGYYNGNRGNWNRGGNRGPVVRDHRRGNGGNFRAAPPRSNPAPARARGRGPVRDHRRR